MWTALLAVAALVACGPAGSHPGPNPGPGQGSASGGGSSGSGSGGAGSGDGAATGFDAASDTGSTGRGIAVDAGPAGQWVDISPPVPKPWADGAKFFYGFGWIDGAKADAPGTIYVGLDHGDDSYSGVWKSTDAGNTWALASQGPNSVLRHTGAQPLVVDPTDSKVVYAGSIKTGLGLYKSTDGGASWSSKSIVPAGIEPDVYWLSIDPHNHLHLLLTFHSAGTNWAASGNAGVLESLDGGATWPNVIQSGGWTGAGQFAFFVGAKNDGSVDAAGSYWIVATQGSGIWRTENAGASWASVGTFNMTHGMESLYRAPGGALYLGSVGKVYRSLDNGRTWTDSGAQSSPDGYGGIVGDDTNIWAMLANTGGGTSGPYRWQTLPIGDTTSAVGASHWTSFGTTTYDDGPNHMTYDPIDRIVYAACWGTGVMRYRLP